MGQLAMRQPGLYRNILPQRAFPLAASVVVMYRLQEEASKATKIIRSASVFIVIRAMVGFTGLNAAFGFIDILKYVKKC